MADRKRAPNKVIWNMQDIQDLIDMARGHCHAVQRHAASQMNPDLLLHATQIERYLNHIERHALDARHNRYKDNVGAPEQNNGSR